MRKLTLITVALTLLVPVSAGARETDACGFPELPKCAKHRDTHKHRHCHHHRQHCKKHHHSRARGFPR